MRRYEPCEECGAPLDPQQRYCVHCAARRGDGTNPSSRYFAAMSQRARRPLVRPPAKSGPASRAAAVAFFALLPVAVGLGVVVGRSGDGGGNDEALLQALREQDTASARTASVAAAPAAAGKGAAKQAKAKGVDKTGGKVVAETDNGTVHQISGFKASEEKTAEDTRIVESNVKQAGETYIKAQQNLPDVIVIGGDADGAPALPTGAEP